MGQVSLRGIRKSYGPVDVIKGIDLDVLDGEFLVFVGPSGCGKSTTLRMIAGLESISAGDLLIDAVRANHQRPADRGAPAVSQLPGDRAAVPAGAHLLRRWKGD